MAETVTCCIKNMGDVIPEALMYHILSHIGMQIFFTEAVRNVFCFNRFSGKIEQVSQIFPHLKR